MNQQVAWRRVFTVVIGLIVALFVCKAVGWFLDRPWVLLIVVAVAAGVGFLALRGRVRVPRVRGFTPSGERTAASGGTANLIRSAGGVVSSPIRSTWRWLKRIVLLAVILTVFVVGARLALQVTNFAERGGLANILGFGIPNLSAGLAAGTAAECDGEMCVAVGPLPVEGRLVVQKTGGILGIGSESWVFVILGEEPKTQKESTSSWWPLGWLEKLRVREKPGG